MDEEVNQIRQNTVAASSRAIYKCSYVRFLLWSVRNKDRLIPRSFFRRLDTSQTDSALRRDMDKYTDGNLENPPIYFAQVTVNDFMSWLLTLKKQTEDRSATPHTILIVLDSSICFVSTTWQCQIL